MLCKIQAVLIQFGDVAQASFTLCIGIYTATAILTSRRLSNKAFAAVLTSLWLFPFLLTILGPHLHRHFDNPFYCGSDEGQFMLKTLACMIDGKAAAYCWISPLHKSYRLPLHFIWILLTTLINIPLYSLIF